MQQNNPMHRPTSAVALAIASIPKSLKKLDRWILWAYTLKKGATGESPKDWTKVPYSPQHGGKVDATKVGNGHSFITAVQALRNSEGKYDGLGFLLGEGLAGIDVDDCIDPVTGELDDRGQSISDQYAATYAEVSPSGTGFKILVDIGADERLAVIGKNTAEIEVYGSRRYFTVTGNLMPGHAQSIANMAEAFANTAAAIGADRQAPQSLALVDMPTESRGRLGIDMPASRELLDHLPFHWCENYLDWIKAGMALHHEFSGSPDALALWDEWSQRSVTNYDPHACADKWRSFGRPGKTIVTVRTLLRDAQAGGWRAPLTIDRAIRDFSAFDEPKHLEPDEDGVYAEPPDWWHRYSVGNMLRVEAPIKEWVWRGLLLAGKVMLLGGSGGSSKSYLMLGAAIQFGLSNSWGPFEACCGETEKVLILYGEEDVQDVHDRLRALRHSLMLGDDEISRIEQRVAVIPLRGKNAELAVYDRATDTVIPTDQLRKLEQRIVDNRVKLLIIDPLALFHGLEENDNHMMSSFVREVDSLSSRTGCAIVLVHHFSKAAGVTARDVNEHNLRGASALVAHARTCVVMHRLQRDESTAWGVQEEDHARWTLFKVVKNNYGPVGAMHWFEVDGHSGAIQPSATQLTYMNSTTIREVAMAHAREQEEVDITEQEERRAREQVARDIERANLCRIALRLAKNAGSLPSVSKLGEALRRNGMPNCTDSKAKRIRTFLLEEEYLYPDGLITAKGDDKLGQLEYSNGVDPDDVKDLL